MMKEVSPSNYNDGNKISNNRSELKIYPTSFLTKSIPNSVYNINTITKNNNLSKINNNITFKITEKECCDINSIVRKSVEKINDLLNSKEFNNRNLHKTLKRSSKNYFSNEKEKMKSKTIKDTRVKTNFTFNINNFLNVPSNKNENEGINMNKKTERYEEEDELINERTFSEKSKINTKIKSNQKGYNYTNRSKNNNYGSNINGYNNNGSGELFRNFVRKKKLFDDGGVNINYNNNNNINIVNFIDNKRKNMKTQKFETK